MVQDREFRREAAQVQAKALLSEIAEPMPVVQWRYIARRVIRNIAMATFELENVARRTPHQIVDDLSTAARKFALMWESLAQLQEATTRETALVNAAVNYELAGYQANAMCIARQLLGDALRAERPAIIDMSSLFLQRRFLQLLDLSRKAQVEPSVEHGLDSFLIEAMALAVASDGFSHAVRFFLAGDQPAFERAIEAFERAESLYASLDLVSESNVVHSIASLLPLMKTRATWTLLPRLAPRQPRWQRYLKLLTRGVGADILRGRSISELWPSQITAIEQGLLDSTSNKIIRMPTSAGKTRIAELTMVHTLVNSPGAKCVYVAPYRALVSELQQSLLNVLSDLGYQVSSVTGTYESDDFEELLFRETDVLVTTPEKLDLVLRGKPEFLDNVRLFVLDETQIIHDYPRGIKYELLLTRLMRKLPGARFLTLSAVLPQETLEDFARWFNASTQEDILTSAWRPSVQRYAMFEWMGQTGVIRYAPEDDIPVLREFVPGVIRQQLFEYINPETGRINRRMFPESAHRAQIAAELAFKFAQLGPVLVFCSQTTWVDSVAKALHERLTLSSLTGQDIPSYFESRADRRSALLAHEWLGENHHITSCLDSGVGVHYARLPHLVRNAIETDFRQRKLHVLVATNTLAQGVNLPVRTVIVHTWSRYVGDSQQAIPARDYWNIAGRAGRAGEETEGLVIHIKVNEADEAAFQYYLRRKEDVEPVQSALYQRLVDLVHRRLSEEALKTDLDPEILAVLVEEGPAPISEDVLREILAGSLVQIQATRNQFPTERLSQLFASVASTLADQVSDPELRKVYSSTGLSSTSCQIIHDHVARNEGRLRTLLSQAGPEHLGEMIDLLLPACLELSEMEPARQFAGSYRDLLKGWIEGTEIPRLISEFGDQTGSPEELGRFIDDLFGYRLPWGISGYIRIAAKVLGIDPTALSDFARFFPSMVKFGLPNPMACWTMSVGVPFRRPAIRLATAYRNEVRRPSHENFLEWLSTLSSERLRYDFGLTSPVLEDVSRAIFISGVNPLLRQYTNLDEFLPHDVEVRGIQYENRSVVALNAQPNQRVHLLAPEMDTGAELDATIIAVERGHLPKVCVRIIQG